MEDVQEYMEQLDGTHIPASVPNDEFAKLPDGKYQARLDNLYVGKSKGDPLKNKQPRVQCVMEFEIMNGPHAWRFIKKYSGMETADQLDYLTKDLRRLGITSFMWSSVQGQFATVLDKIFEVELKTKGEYQAVWIQKKLQRDDILVSDKLKECDVPF